ncbi:phospholipase D-like domain-containing protein [Ramlibacter rhizophilus]|uniref:Cardiolipin synthase B n=1 Tax=Ramlibacter rhizophilus TaxID=1781167 RepID=A0A4Z0BKR2_9BURK|nr:phospholipase D-like domain-containing protein [Ramlibacter rhizophilus]TFY99912.1 cardiolipin synthase B [Ramlibacter rhizophilus]
MDASWWVAISAAVAAGSLLVLWSVRRHNNPVLDLRCDLPIDKLMPSLAGLTLGRCAPGNAVQVLENGAFFDVLVEHLRAARRSIHFETFLWKDGVLGQRLADVLCERARAGVQVRLTLDATGTRGMGNEVRRQLQDSGCRIARFHPLSFKTLGMLNDRTHRKMVVIDGREAFIGGHCVVDEWLGDAEDGQHFADVSVLLHGPIVHSIQAAFSENWGAVTGEMFVGDAFFPPLEPAGDVSAFAAYVKPEGSAPAVKILHHAAICLARRRLWIQNPYFIPEPEAVRSLGEAVRRGVDVRVLMPSTSGSDNPMVQHAGRHNFERLLESGVRLFEYPHTLLHQKIMTIDGAWSAIGSSNFDDRSFEINDEITLGILDTPLAARLDAVFERYAARANEIRLDRWRRRGLRNKVLERVCYAFNEVL